MPKYKIGDFVIIPILAVPSLQKDIGLIVFIRRDFGNLDPSERFLYKVQWLTGIPGVSSYYEESINGFVCEGTELDILCLSIK